VQATVKMYARERFIVIPPEIRDDIFPHSAVRCRISAGKEITERVCEITRRQTHGPCLSFGQKHQNKIPLHHGDSVDVKVADDGMVVCITKIQ